MLITSASVGAHCVRQPLDIPCKPNSSQIRSLFVTGRSNNLHGCTVLAVGSQTRAHMQPSSHKSASFDPVEIASPRSSVWLLAVVVLGVSLTVGWMMFLAYGLITLVEHAL